MLRQFEMGKPWATTGTSSAISALNAIVDKLSRSFLLRGLAKSTKGRSGPLDADGLVEPCLPCCDADS